MQCIRAALHSNATFSRLAEKLDILCVNATVLKALTALDFGEGASASQDKTRVRIKATADLFETLVAAYCMEYGFNALCDWVCELYGPLIAASERVYMESYVATEIHVLSIIDHRCLSRRSRFKLKPRVLQTHTSRIRNKPYTILSPTKPNIRLKRYPHSTRHKTCANSVRTDLWIVAGKLKATGVGIPLRKPAQAEHMFIDLTQDDVSDDSSEDEMTPFMRSPARP